MQNALLACILCAVLFMCLKDESTYSRVYISANGQELVTNTRQTWLECKSSTILVDPSFYCIKE